MVAFCDVIESAAERAREGRLAVTTPPPTPIGSCATTALICSTSPPTTTPTTRWPSAGAKAGKHMVLEKPMCIMRHEAVEVAEAVEQAASKW